MPRIYSQSETLENIAKNLIPNHHPELATARIMYVFVDKAGAKGGQELYGKAQKLSGFQEWALETDFVITVSEEKWKDLTTDQQQAVVDHLLERCTGEEDDDGSMKWATREPEVQEFSSILDRHGAWHSGLTSFVEVAQSINIDRVAEEAEESEMSLADNLVTTSNVN